VIEYPCSLLVALAEEGWVEGPLVEEILKRYLEPVFDQFTPGHPDCLLLGCTHFPVFSQALQHIVGPDITIIDSGIATAMTVYELLMRQGLAHESHDKIVKLKFLATDSLPRFKRIAEVFLRSSIAEASLELVEL